MNRDAPNDRRAYKRVGYTFQRVTTCRSCKQQVEFWKTHKGNDVLFDITPGQTEISVVTCHFQTCPARKKNHDAAPDPNETRRRHAVKCRQATNALAVIAVYGDGQWAADVDPTLSAEDVRHEIITTANLLRRAMKENGHAR